MQTHAGRRTAPDQPPTTSLPGWPLLHLPAPAQHVLVLQLDRTGSSNLRLTCKAAQQLVNAGTTNIRLRPGQLSSDTVSSIRAHFPCVTDLRLIGDPNWRHEPQQRTTEREVIKRLTGACPWASITTIYLSWMPEDVATMAIDGCRNLASCEILAPGYMTYSWAISSLARRPHLRHLRYKGSGPTAECASTLLSLRALTSLEYQYTLGTNPMPDLPWDFRGMTALQKLALRRNIDDAEDAGMADGNPEELQRRRAQDDVMYARMQLPKSLHELQLDLLPRLPLRLLCLTELRLAAATLMDEDLARLSSGCPTLEKLRVKSLRLSPAAHAPLAHITSFEVADTWHAQGAVRLAAIMPALQHLRLAASGECEQPGQLFLGADCLELLDGSCGCMREDTMFNTGASMPISMFEALATLPRLSAVHLNAEPAHVEGMQLLAQVTSVVWTIDAVLMDMLLQGAKVAFTTHPAPGRLHDASILFQDDDEAQSPTDVIHLADAIISWLIKSPSIHHVAWSSGYQGPGMLSHIQLAALAMTRRLEHISIDPAYGHGPVPETLVSMAHLIGSQQHVRVQIQGRFY